MSHRLYFGLSSNISNFKCYHFTNDLFIKAFFFDPLSGPWSDSVRSRFCRRSSIPEYQRRPRKRRPKTPYENEKPSRKRRHITKTSSKEVGITFVDKDYVHETHHENEDPYRNLEFWIWHVCSLLRNISKEEPHGTFNGTTLKLKRDFRRG